MLLGTLNFAVCTDPRDRIFGFLGIAGDWLAQRNPPDYTFSTPEVYMRDLKTPMEATNTLDVLSNCWYPKIVPEIPSWVSNIGYNISNISYQFKY